MDGIESVKFTDICGRILKIWTGSSKYPGIISGIELTRIITNR